MKSVLVVDDEKSVRDSIKMILEYEKFEVQYAGDGPTGEICCDEPGRARIRVG